MSTQPAVVTRFQRFARPSVAAEQSSGSPSGMLSAHLRIQLSQRRREPLQIAFVRLRRNVDVRCQSRKALQPRGQSADQNVPHMVARQDSYDPLRIERRNVSHDGQPRRSGSTIPLRAGDLLAKVAKLST